ncbi:ORF128 [Ranid herpesvirus 1]|uniref:ORF128 n=1 Tax=Ranid herpesvirus 1 TaxID=85655 RepID=Q14VK2_9VIRU|nr:ORF128 [Ranid herpesvirus 1]ABG25778.1 ORF128 [Ranid herpesvirus 1]
MELQMDETWPLLQKYLDSAYDFENGPHEHPLPAMHALILTCLYAVDQHLWRMARDPDVSVPLVTVQYIHEVVRPHTLDALAKAYRGEDPGHGPSLPWLELTLDQLSVACHPPNYVLLRELAQCLVACLLARYAYRRPHRKDLRAQLYCLFVSLRGVPPVYPHDPVEQRASTQELEPPGSPCHASQTPMSSYCPDCDLQALREAWGFCEPVELSGWIGHALAVVEEELIERDLVCQESHSAAPDHPNDVAMDGEWVRSKPGVVNAAQRE